MPRRRTNAGLAAHEARVAPRGSSRPSKPKHQPVPVVTPSGKREHRHWVAAKGHYTRSPGLATTGLTRGERGFVAPAPRKHTSGLTKALMKMVGTGVVAFQPQKQAEFKKAGLTIGGGGNLGESFVKGGARFTLGTPAFAYDVGSAVVHDAPKLSADVVHQDPLQFLKDLRRSESGKIIKGQAKGTAQTVRHPLRDPFQSALLLSALIGGGAVAGTRAAGTRGALAEGGGVRAALTRPGHEGGSVLHTPIARETELRMGGKVVHRLEPDNPAWRPAHRRRTARLQAGLDRGPVDVPWREAWAGRQGGIPGKVAAVVSKKMGMAPEDVFGREWRAERRIEPVKGQGHADALIREAKNLKPEELQAMRVALIEGRRAFSHPDETVSRHVSTHMGYAEQGIHPELHRGIAERTAKAAAVLRNPSPQFLRATARARLLSRRMGKELVLRKLLSPESLQSSRATMAEVYGRPMGMGKAPPGSGYFPSGPPFTTLPKSVSAEGYVARPGPLGIGPKSPSYGRQGTLKHRTGEGVAQGVVENPAQAIASAYHGHQLGNQAMDFYKDAWKAGAEVKTHPEQIGIRSTAKSTKEHRAEIARAVHEGDETALAKALEDMTADTIVKGSDGEAVGRRLEGVRWIDKRALKDIRIGMTDNIVMQGARAVNVPVRFAQVYVRPAYVVHNLPQNYLMGALQHGPVTTARAMGRAQKIHGTMTGDIVARAMGTSKTESFSVGARKTAGPLSRASQWATREITSITDRHFRDAMFLTRARERGFTSDADLSRLVNDPALHNDFVAVTRRARRDAVDFDSLAPRERQIAEAAYFYPWMSRATTWAGRAVANRPISSAVLGQGAAYSSPRMEKKLGPHPSWMAGLLKTRWGNINPQPLSPYATPGQLGQSAANIAKGESVFGELGTPFFQLGGADLGGTAPGGVRSQLGSTFPGSVLKRAGINPNVAGKPLFGAPSKTYSKQGVAEAIGPFAIGGLYPRTPDKAVQREQYLRDLPPGKRASVKVFDERQAVFEAAKSTHPEELEDGRLPKKLRSAFNLEAERQGLYADAVHGHKSGTTGYHLAKLEADLRFLQRHGVLDAKVASGVLEQARSAALDVLKETRADISRRYYQGEGGQLYYISHAKKAVGLK
jgi:hypothetical protein